MTNHYLTRREFLRRLSASAFAALLAGALLTGCGGGGGGGGGNPGGGGGGGTATITGVLKEKATGNVLPARTVNVQGNATKATSDSSGRFTLAGVPVQTVTLEIHDSNGTSNGTASIAVNAFVGSPRDVGTITLDLSGVPPPP